MDERGMGLPDFDNMEIGRVEDVDRAFLGGSADVPTSPHHGVLITGRHLKNLVQMGHGTLSSRYLFGDRTLFHINYKYLVL